jgi:hypothetical protein
MVKFPSSDDPDFRGVIGILQEFRHTLVLQSAEQRPQNVPMYNRRLPPGMFVDGCAPQTSSIHSVAADSFEHARPDVIPNGGAQIEAETNNYALSVDVLGFLKIAQFIQDIPETLQCTVSSFLHGGIQPFVKDIATIGDNNGGQTTSGHDSHSPSTLKLLWVHMPINNTKWVHVYSPIASRVVKY